MSSPETDAQFRIDPARPIEELRRAAMAADPPQEEGTFRKPELVTSPRSIRR